MIYNEMTKKLTTEEFIEKARKVHGDKYDYSKVEYLNNKIKVCIICPKHGEFWQLPSNHLNGLGCKKCASEKHKMSLLMTTEEFITRAQEIHGNKYDYSKVDMYHRDSKGRVCIICPKHGEFWQVPSNHLKGVGCRLCSIENETMTVEEFISRANKAHNNKYDYSKVEYINNNTKVCIICPEHGEFWQVPSSHLNGIGCPKCSHKYMDTEYFIEKSTKIHDNKYDYSKVKYKNWITPVCIICPEHGEFWQIPSNHLKGQGCPICGKEKAHNAQRGNTEIFIEKARQVHGDKYDYSKVEYDTIDSKVCIICPEHGEFWQSPYNHLKGCECPKCARNKVRDKLSLSPYSFICKAIQKHGNKYDYSKIDYKNNRTKVCIICPEHGEFWQEVDNHLQGAGCPKCKSSKLEGEIRDFLKEQGIQFEEQKRFDWLGLQSLDFYLPESHIAIECQGAQHYRPVSIFGGNTGFDIVQQRDTKKKQLCEENGISVIYYTHEDIENDGITYFNQEELLDALRK